MAQAPAPLPSLALVLNQRNTLPSSALSYTLSLQTAGLNYVGQNSVAAPAYLPSIGLILGVDSRANKVSYALTVRDATLKAARRLVSSPIALTLTPQAAALTRTGANAGGDAAYLPSIGLLLQANSSNKFLICASTPYALTLRAATLATGLGLTAETVSYTVSMAPAERDLEMNGDTTAFSFSPQAAILNKGYLPAVADALAYNLTLKSAFLVYETPGVKVLPAFGLSYAVSLQDAAFTTNPLMNADALAYVLAIQSAGLSWSGESAVVPVIVGAGMKKRRVVFDFHGKTYIVPEGQEEALLSALLVGDPVPKPSKRKREERRTRRRAELLSAPPVVVPDNIEQLFPDYALIRQQLNEEAELQRILDTIVLKRLQELDEEETMALLLA